MSDHRLLAVRLAEAMKRNGIVRTDDVLFGSPRIKGTGTPVFAVMDRFCGGDSIAFIAEDYDLTTKQVERAIRFAAMFPRADHPAFWSDPKAQGYVKFLEVA